MIEKKPTPALRRELAEAEHTLSSRLGQRRPRVALILGSGVSRPSIDSLVQIQVDDLPGLPRSTVPGHPPFWIAGEIEAVPVVVASGRVHRYEGFSLPQVTFGVRLMAAIGCEAIIVSNAAGGIRDDLTPGTLMLIRDHLNFLGDSPLSGAHDEKLGERFVDLTEAYDGEWGSRVETGAQREEIGLTDGVYACVPGPQYETPAEIRMLQVVGADAVGMSTVPEVIVARQCGLRVFGLSLITNRAAGMSETPLSHDEVLEIGRASEATVGRLLREIVITA